MISKLRINRFTMLKSKKASIPVVIAAVMAVVIIGFSLWFLYTYGSEPFKKTMDKLLSKDTGDYSDPDNDKIINWYDKCPSKACTPKPGETVEPNIMNPRAGCTAKQTPSTDRTAATC